MIQNTALFSLVLVFGICFSLMAASDVNLLKDSGFEGGIAGQAPLGWSFYGSDPTGSVVVDDKDAHSGKHSLKLVKTKETGNYGVRFEIAELKPDTLYTFSAYMKTTLLVDAGWDQAQRVMGMMERDATGTKAIEETDAQGKKVSKKDTAVAAPYPNWTRMMGMFKTTKDVNDHKVYIYFLLCSKAQCLWVDAIQVEQGDEATDYKEKSEAAAAAELKVKTAP